MTAATGKKEGRTVKKFGEVSWSWSCLDSTELVRYLQWLHKGLQLRTGSSWDEDQTAEMLLILPINNCTSCISWEMGSYNNSPIIMNKHTFIYRLCSRVFCCGGGGPLVGGPPPLSGTNRLQNVLLKLGWVSPTIYPRKICSKNHSQS